MTVACCSSWCDWAEFHGRLNLEVFQLLVSWHHLLKEKKNFQNLESPKQLPALPYSAYASTAVRPRPHFLTTHLQLADWQVWIAEIISHHFGRVRRHLNDVTWGVCKCRHRGAGFSVAKSDFSLYTVFYGDGEVWNVCKRVTLIFSPTWGRCLSTKHNMGQIWRYCKFCNGSIIY